MKEKDEVSGRKVDFATTLSEKQLVQGILLIQIIRTRAVLLVTAKLPILSRFEIADYQLLKKSSLKHNIEDNRIYRIINTTRPAFIMCIYE